jgi:hypothetical protein
LGGKIMQRREFFGVLCGAILLPLAAWAQQPLPPIGSSDSDEAIQITAGSSLGKTWLQLTSTSR